MWAQNGQLAGDQNPHPVASPFLVFLLYVRESWAKSQWDLSPWICFECCYDAHYGVIMIQLTGAKASTHSSVICDGKSVGICHHRGSVSQ